MDETKKKPATAPVKIIRHGAIAASIWKRQATSGFEYFDFTVSRSWKTSSTGKGQEVRRPARIVWTSERMAMGDTSRNC